MFLWENIKIGIRNLSAHKLRSLLSVLGVVFGVAAVIAMLSIGEGARREALEQIRLMGTNNILVRALPLSEGRQIEARENLSMGLTLSDARRIKAISPMVGGVFSLKESLGTARFAAQESTVRVVSTNPEYLSLVGLKVASGRFIRKEDLDHQRRVCVLGWTKARELFPQSDPLGQIVEINGQLYKVIGVLENRDLPKGKNLLVQVRDINNDVYVPLNPVGAGSEKDTNVDEILIQVRDADFILPAANIVKNILERIHHDVEDYEIIVPQELLKQSQRTQRIFNVVMGSIAGISLLVGGIGIMNIMLAVITERTREIGVRRALGASRRDIIRQFLVETMVLTVTGGLIGILLGTAGSEVINFYVEWRTVVSPYVVMVSFMVSVMVGIIFGMYPAYKAARMNPIEALRYE